MRTAVHKALLTIGILLLSAEIAPAAPRDVLAYGDNNNLWTARVSTVKDAAPYYEQTELRGRLGFGADWTALPVVSPRAVSLASCKGELAVLLQGQWFVVSPDNARTGPSLPGSARMLALGSDADNLWAIGLSEGATSTTMPATRGGATAPSSAPSMSATTRRLNVYHYESGNWGAPTVLPEAVVEDPTRLSMTVIDGRPVIAWLGADGMIQIIQMVKDHQWGNARTVRISDRHEDFKIIAIEGKPALWVLNSSAPASTMPGSAVATTRSDAAGGGILYRGDNFALKTPLETSDMPAGGSISKTIAEGLGRLRLIGATPEGKWYEQNYDLDGKPVAVPTVMAEAGPQVIPFRRWLVGAMLVVLAAAGAAIVQRGRTVPSEIALPADGKLQLAPLRLRISAGVVDLLPVLAAAYSLQEMAGKDGSLTIDRLSIIHLLTIAAAAYVLHTLVAELICGQSLGKMIFNLRVVGPDGRPAGAISIVFRNVIRVVDIGLLFIPFNSLHQRLGDMAGGTVVIAKDLEIEPEEPGAEGQS